MTTMARKLFDKLALKRSIQKETTHEDVTPVAVEKKEPAVKRARMATSHTMSKARSAMAKGSKAFVNKFTCCVRPKSEDECVNGSDVPTKATKKANNKTKKQLMITARGEDEQLVLPAAQVVVPVWDGETTPQLPPPRELFGSAHVMDRLAKEAALEAALKQQADAETA